MFIAVSHWYGSCLWFLVHHYHRILIKTPQRYPQSHGDPPGLHGPVPQDQSLHKHQRVLDGVGVRVDKPKAWLIDYKSSDVGRLGCCKSKAIIIDLGGI